MGYSPKIISRCVPIAAIVLAGLSSHLTQAAGALEEVIVTATKRSASLQNVEASVTALNRDDIAKMGIKEGRDLFERLANVSLAATASEAQPQIAMRGIGYLSVQPSAVQPVGIFQDEVALNSPQLAGTFMFDLERIEVMRGPQNTLYGRNTTGGAINLIARKPVVGDDMTGNFAATYGRFDEVVVDGGVSMPLGDRAALRLAANFHDRGGMRKNLYDGNDRDETNKQQARALLAVKFSDNLSGMFNFHMGEIDATSRTPNIIGFLDPANPDATTFDPAAGLSGNCPFAGKGDFGSGCVTGAGGVTSQGPRYVNEDIQNPLDRIENWGGSMRLEWELPNMTVTSITAYEDVVYNNIRGEGFPTNLFLASRNQYADQISQELRFASPEDQDVRWMAGAYYFKEDSDTQIIISLPNLGMGNGGGMWSQSDQEDESMAIFGEAEWDVSEKVTVTAGLRWSRDSKGGSADVGVTRGTAGVPLFREGADASEPFTYQDLLLLNPPVVLSDIPYDETWTEWGGKIGASYQYSEDLMAYASVSRGTKAGGFPTGPNIIIQDVIRDGDGLFDSPVDPEIVIAYEVGMKAEWMDNALRTNLAVFYNDYQDQQLQTFIIEDIGGIDGPVGRLVNIGDSYTTGAELETVWIPPMLDDTRISFTAGFLKTEIEKDNTGRNLEGNLLTNAPELTLGGSIDKSWMVGDGDFITVNLNGNYTSSREFDVTNADLLSADSFVVFNAFANYEFGGTQQYRVSIWGKNITDEDWINDIGQVSGGGGVSVISNNPRTYGVTFSAAF